MTVCRYYLQGTCRFGNRCRFEHIDPDHSRDSYHSSNYSNRKNDYGYQDRYRTQENYQDRYRTQENYQDRNRTQGNYHERNYKYENPEGPRRYNNYETPNQQYRSEKHSQYGNYDNHAKSEQLYQNDSYKGYSNKHDKSQYEWVSDDYKKQHQKKQPYHGTSEYKSLDSNKGFSFKTLDDNKGEDINEEKMILAEQVKEDVTAWELGNQWPFTCYSPFSKRGDFPGFKDISFEELRYEALKAEENNSFPSFVENIVKTLADVQNRRNKLKQPTESVLSMIEKLRAGEILDETAVTEESFSLVDFTQSFSEDIADEIPSIAQSASSFSFKDVPATSNSTFSFKNAFSQNVQSASSSSFSFKVPATDISTMSSKATDSDFPMYTPLEQLSEQDKEQFSASTFTLGKIPTVPPPKVLCF